MRIHKTASEALAAQICDRLSPETVCQQQFEWQVRSLRLADLCQFTFFHGHITPSTLSATLTHFRVFTMLRSPKERLLSCYFYWREGAKYLRNQFFDAIAPLSLLEFLCSDEPVIRRATWNVQARLLAGGQFGGSNDLRQNVFGPWLAGRELVAEATRAMQDFALVGIAENYQASLRAAYTLLELGEPPPPKRINVTPGRPDSYEPLLSNPEIADALSRLTEADQVVYDNACNRLSELSRR